MTNKWIDTKLRLSRVELTRGGEESFILNKNFGALDKEFTECSSYRCVPSKSPSSGSNNSIVKNMASSVRKLRKSFNRRGSAKPLSRLYRLALVIFKLNTTTTMR